MEARLHAHNSQSDSGWNIFSHICGIDIQGKYKVWIFLTATFASSFLHNFQWNNLQVELKEKINRNVNLKCEIILKFSLDITNVIKCHLQLSPGIILMSGGAHEGGILQS